MKKKQNISEKIKIYMLKNNLTQRELAKKLKISASAVSQILSGKASLRTDTITKISKSLGVPNNYFFENTGNISGNNSPITINSSSENTRLALMEKEIEILKKEVEIIKLKLKR